MCELFGVNSPEPIPVNSLLREFFSHGSRHPHGWGMAFFSGEEPVIEKQPMNACKSHYLEALFSTPKEAADIIAHIRLGTKGVMIFENTHPFTGKDGSGRSWTLAHNGTIFESDLLDPLFYEQTGSTDSERILVYILKKMNALSPASAEERFLLMDEIVHEITPKNKVNLLVYDGELLYVHTNYRASLHVAEIGPAKVFSTQPLNSGNWEPLPMNTLFAYQAGELKFTGTTHTNEYFDNSEKTKHLYLDYAAL